MRNLLLSKRKYDVPVALCGVIPLEYDMSAQNDFQQLSREYVPENKKSFIRLMLAVLVMEVLAVGRGDSYPKTKEEWYLV